MNSLEIRLKEQLSRRKDNGSCRSLLPLPRTDSVTPSERTDFSSNDYLGMARCREQLQRVDQEFQRLRCTEALLPASRGVLGATGSRLLSGDSYYARQLEQDLAELHNRPSGLLFNSGYDANLSVLSSIPQQQDIVVLDELCHNSIVMGVRMGRVSPDRVLMFQHNNVSDLARLLCNMVAGNEEPSSHIFVIVESVYSMDGDVAPLAEICAALERYPSASLVVDEAHGLGIYGRTNVSDMFVPESPTLSFTEPTCAHLRALTVPAKNQNGGTGVLAALNLEHHPSLLCSIHTFGKAAGCHGAFVATSTTVVEYLVNYARPFIYSTALPSHSLVSIRCSYEAMTGTVGEERRRRLFDLVALFRSRMLQKPSSCRQLSDAAWREKVEKLLLPSPSPIQCIVTPGNHPCIVMAKQLRDAGFDVYPIRSPTVPVGKERIRIIVHSHNTREEVLLLTNTLTALLVLYVIAPSPRLVAKL